MSAQEMPKAYEPAEVEKKWYSYWESNGLFKGRPNPEKKPYSIVIPPPNVTGILTMGHVLNNTLQDILMRWHRMEGYECCWFPGTDHAGIATEARVNKELMKTEHISRDSAPPATGTGNASPWTRDSAGRCARSLSIFTTRDTSIAADA